MYSINNCKLKTKTVYLQCALLQYAELEVNIQSDFPLVEKFLQLNMRLLQLLQYRLHMGHRAALGPETTAPTHYTKLKTNIPKQAINK